MNNEIKPVFVLGAGASASVIKPPITTNNLLQQILDNNHYQKDNLFKEQLHKIEKLISSIYPSKIPPIDQVLSLIDIALYEKLPINNEFSLEDLHSIRNGLVYLIQDFINNKINVNKTVGNALKDLANLIVKNYGLSASVISLNWDCLFESHISEYLENQGHKISYGFDLGYSSNSPSFLILKPHGSLNWQFCTRCLYINYSEDFTSNTNLSYSICKMCDNETDLEPVIVAPSLINEYTPELLFPIWRKVEECIASCTDIVFVGYSLASNDLRIIFHIIRGLQKRRLKDIPHIRVIDKKTCGGNYNETIKNRYIELFGPNVTYSDLEKGLEQYLNDELPLHHHNPC